MIELPNRVWFLQKQGHKYLTNTYSGSLGTSPQTGCISTTTFNYRVYVKITAENQPISFHAECFWRTPWSHGAKIVDFVECEFSISQDGLQDAENWLITQYGKGI